MAGDAIQLTNVFSARLRVSSRMLPPSLSTAKDRLPFALIALTFATGLVDAVSFLSLGRIFTANMTGNIVILGLAVAAVPGLSFARSFMSLLAFLAGAALGGRLALRLACEHRRWLLSVGLAEGSLLFAAAAASGGFDTV